MFRFVHCLKDNFIYTSLYKWFTPLHKETCWGHYYVKSEHSLWHGSWLKHTEHGNVNTPLSSGAKRHKNWAGSAWSPSNMKTPLSLDWQLVRQRFEWPKKWYFVNLKMLHIECRQTNSETWYKFSHESLLITWCRNNTDNERLFYITCFNSQTHYFKIIKQN